MEKSTKPHEQENPSMVASPNNSSNSSSCSNGIPTTPKTIFRSEITTYPTTFVQADSSSFKQVVQMLTGSSETAKIASKPSESSSKNGGSLGKTGPQKPAFKLYERRNSVKKLKISTLVPGHDNGGISQRKPEILSPSILDFPSLTLSPVTPLISDPFNKVSDLNSNEEDRAIAEKRFYFHPSPVTTPRGAEPRLLALFPVTSPKISSS